MRFWKRRSSQNADRRPFEIADFIQAECYERDLRITNLKLQKLLYYAEAWSLASRDEALFDEPFQAWIHGPVLASQYQRFKAKWGWQPIWEKVDRPQLDEKLRLHLVEIVEMFGSVPDHVLTTRTQSEAPWIEARGDLDPATRSDAPISKDAVRIYYKAVGGFFTT